MSVQINKEKNCFINKELKQASAVKKRRVHDVNFKIKRRERLIE